MTRTTRFKIAGSAMVLAALVMLTPGRIYAEEGHDHSGHGHEEGHSDEVKIAPEAMEVFGVSLGNVARRVLTETAVAPARISYNAEAMAHVGSPLAGRAGELKVRLGDVVGKGALLAIIESPELGRAQSELLQKRSLREAAESAVEVARLSFERAEELRKTNSVSVTDLLTRQGDFKRAEGDLKVAEAAYLAAENNLHILGIGQEQVERLLANGEVTTSFELRSPIAGTIVQREVTPGEIVSPDRDALMVIADMANLWVLADVPERVAHRVAAGSKGRISIGAAEGAAIEGTVTYIAPELNPRTRTAEVRLVIDASEAIAPAEEPALTEAQLAEFKAKGDWCGEHGVPESTCVLCNPGLAKPAAPAPIHAGQLLRPGMFAQVELELGGVAGAAQEPVLAVAEDAVQTVEGREAVFVPADEPDTFKPAPLVLGPRIGRFFPVLSGLKEGAVYVEKGSFLLKAELGKEGAAHEH